jgi:LDH2 family malate/lactate/ureidoglycolate dehydrogenase
VSFLNPLPDLPGKGIGHFVGAMRIDAFRPANEFKQHMDNWIDRFKSATPINLDIPVIIPGEPEFANHKVRMASGIPLNNLVVDDLKKLAQELNVSWIDETIN